MLFGSLSAIPLGWLLGLNQIVGVGFGMLMELKHYVDYMQHIEVYEWALSQFVSLKTLCCLLPPGDSHFHALETFTTV